MKDWKVWAFVIVLFLIVKNCGGCNGCGSDSDIPEQKPTTFTKTCHRCGKTFETHHDTDKYCDRCMEVKGFVDEMNKTERQRHGYVY